MLYKVIYADDHKIDLAETDYQAKALVAAAAARGCRAIIRRIGANDETHEIYRVTRDEIRDLRRSAS